MPQPTRRGERGGLHLSGWNLLLLLPLLMLVTPWFNKTDPRLFGMPFFYWIQFLWVVVGVASVAIVNSRTRERSPRADVDELDEGANR